MTLKTSRIAKKTKLSNRDNPQGLGNEFGLLTIESQTIHYRISALLVVLKTGL